MGKKLWNSGFATSFCTLHIFRMPEISDVSAEFLQGKASAFRQNIFNEQIQKNCC